MKRISEWENFVKQPAASKLPESDKQAVLSFLMECEPNAAAAGYTADEIAGRSTDIPLCAYEYGEYYWDSRDILYFEKYDMPLRSDFLDMLLKSVKE